MLEPVLNANNALSSYHLLWSIADQIAAEHLKTLLRHSLFNGKFITIYLEEEEVRVWKEEVIKLRSAIL